MQSKDCEPFYNKIFFCDVIGYSKLDPHTQYTCLQTLNEAAHTAITGVGARLESDVVALPTGDGLILNYLHPAADIHLRTALILLSAIEGAKINEVETIKLRIGINSFVDTLVTDINGKRNVVGSGINTAQRVMDLGQHAQIMMHDRVRIDLENYLEHKDHIKFIGNFSVKHGVNIPISQYLNESKLFLSRKQINSPNNTVIPNFNFDDILKNDIKDEILRISLDHRAIENLPLVQGFIEDKLADDDAEQQSKVWTVWVATELIENAFKHNTGAIKSGIELVISKTHDGRSISVRQPDVKNFNLDRILCDPNKNNSFMQIVQKRGLGWRIDRHRGQLEVVASIPNGLSYSQRQKSENNVNSSLDNSQSSFIRYAAFSYDVHIDNGICLIRTRGQIGEKNAAAFTETLSQYAKNSNDKYSIICVDLEGVSYISSRGLRAFTLCKKEAAIFNRELHICNTVNSVMEIFSISRYDKILKIWPDFESVRAYMLES